MLAASAVAAVSASAEPVRPEISTLLTRMLNAAASLPIRGVCVTMRPGSEGINRTVARRVVRDGLGRSLDFTLSPETEKFAATQHDLQWTRMYDPQTRTLRIKRAQPIPRTPQEIERRVRLIQRNFRLSIRGREQLAGRTTWRLDLDPKFPGGHHYLLGLDTRTGLELYREETDENGVLVNLTMFRSVEFPKSIRSDELTLPQFRTATQLPLADAPSTTNIGELEKAAGFPLHLPASMPGGYEFESCQLAVVQNTRVACLRYTDGFAALTICQARLPARNTQTSRNLVLLPFGELMVETQHADRRTMVVGHAGAAILTAVADSLRHPREAAWLNWLVGQFRTTAADVTRLRHSGLPLDVITALMTISRRTGTPVSRLAGMALAGYDWHDIAARFRVPTEEIDQLIARQCRR